MGWPVTSHAMAMMIVGQVALTTGISIAEIVGSSRNKHVVRARREAARQLREAEFSYPEIGRALGGRHHTTCLALLGQLGRQVQVAAEARGI